MEILSGVAVSVLLLASLPTLLFTCSIFRRIFKRKKSEKTNEESDVEQLKQSYENPLYDHTRNCREEVKQTNVEVVNEEENWFSQNNILKENGKADMSENADLSGNADVSGNADISGNADGIGNITTTIQNTPIEEEQAGELETKNQVEVDAISKDEIASEMSIDKEMSSLQNLSSLETTKVNNDSNTGMSLVDGCSIDMESKSDLHMLNENIGDLEDLSRYQGSKLTGGWGQNVQVTDLLRLGIIDTKTADEIMKNLKTEPEKFQLSDTLKSYLVGSNPIAGLIDLNTNEKKSIYTLAKEGFIRREIALNLLEAQAATGNILDPLSGKKLTLNEAVQQGLLDKVYEAVLSRAGRAVTGYKTSVTNEILAFGQAMKRGLVMEKHGMQFLEAQLVTGGIIDHQINVKLPIDLAIKMELIDDVIAEKLSSACADIPDAEKPDVQKYFCDPSSEEMVTYRELIRRCITDETTGLLLLPFQAKQNKKFHTESTQP